MTERPATLLPPRPEEQTGWRHFLRIWREYPTAPVELLIGGGAFMRGVYVVSPGHHDALLHFPAAARVLVAIVMAVAGAVQVLACLYEWGRLRAASAIVLVGLLVYLGAVYVSVPNFFGGPGEAVVLFYGIFAAGEYWVAVRAPAVVPLLRWFIWWRKRVNHE